jgi:hypothetical protein
MSINRFDDIYIDEDGIPNKPLKFTQKKYQYLFNKNFFESQKTNFKRKHVSFSTIEIIRVEKYKIYNKTISNNKKENKENKNCIII